MLILAPPWPALRQTLSLFFSASSTKFTLTTIHAPFSFSLSLLGTSLFNWTNESPLFFRGPSWSMLATPLRGGLRRGVWLGRCGSALFTNTTWPCEVSQRWEPGVWNSQALPVLPFFIDGCSPPRSAQNLAGFQTLDRPDVSFELR